MNNYVSDIIEKSYTQWDNQTNVFLNADTGTGKTTFLIEELGLFAARNDLHILYLCNRTALKKDINKRLETLKKDKSKKYCRLAYNIHVDTYQNFEKKELSGIGIETTLYDYIFCDESHYFLVDGTFNRNTYTSFNAILSYPCCKIWATATGQFFFPYLKRKILENYPEQKVVDTLLPVEQIYSHVDSLKFYNSCEERDTIIYNLLKTDPDAHVLIFTDKKMHFSEVDESFEDDCEILVSKNALSAYSAAERECIQQSWNYVEQHNHQKKSIMFATCSLDNGVDIKDKKLKAVFCEVMVPETVLQCLGRKRDASTKVTKDICTFYIKNQPERKIEYRLKKELETLDKLHSLARVIANGDVNSLSEGAFDELLHSECSDFIVFKYTPIGETVLPLPAFNDLRVERLQQTIRFLSEMLSMGFAEYLKKKWFNSYLKEKTDNSGIIGPEAEAERNLIKALRKEYKGLYIGCVSTYDEPNIDNIRRLMIEYLGSSYYFDDNQRVKLANAGFGLINKVLFHICLKNNFKIIEFEKYSHYQRLEDAKTVKKVAINNKNGGNYYMFGNESKLTE